MYTQCPDCSTAFRVTAEVLKQAAGKVRCGGCGNAFNALEYLSEQKPATTAPKEPEPSLPELTPDAPGESGSLPESISSEQSAALLKTLDELAGSDIRIEDTGVEWRVLDDEEEDADDFADVVDTREPVIDELLDDSPTPVDQFLTATPNDVEAAEVFEESANAAGRTPVDELRFDDNTPLPDDFDFDDESSRLPETQAVEAAEPVIEHEEPQADLDLSEPDEWEDILDEFDDQAQPARTPLEAELAALDATLDQQVTEPEEQAAEASPAAAHDDQELLDMDTQFALQAEAMGIDLSGMHNELEEETEAASEESEESEESEQSEETIDAAPGTEVDVSPDDSPQQEPEEVPGELAEEEPDLVAEQDDAQLDLIEDEQGDAPLEFGAVEKALADLEAQSDVFDEDFFDSSEEVETEAEAETPDHEEELELIEDVDLDAQPDLKEELSLSTEPYPEAELELDEPSGPAIEDAEDTGDHVVPPMTEEEQTINMMIDQDLLSLAVEDEDGFASTIIIPGKDADKKDKKKDRKKDKRKKKDKSGKKKKPVEVEAPGFETIIMEGEHIRSAHDDKKLEADAAAAAELVAESKAQEAALVAASKGNRGRLIAGIVVLLLLLVVQVLHQSREALATIPLFNDVVGPVYRAIGKPLSPAWDITGWRIEATKGSIEEDDGQLVVYSRIGNNSDEALPYPIINISLTDRFEETLGSRQLDPAEYLPDNLDPSKLVQPGSNFNAVISIQSPSAEASGYELDVCYRVSAGQLRCAIADFK